MYDKQSAPGRSAASDQGNDHDAGTPGKSTLAHAASIPEGGGGGDGAGVPDLATTSELKKDLGTSYFPGPGGTVIACDLSARIFGNSHTNGSASISGTTTTSNGKPDGQVAFNYNHVPFNISLIDDPIKGHKLHAQAGVTGSWDNLNGSIHITSNKDDLQIRLDGYVKIPGPHHSQTQLGIGVYLTIRVVKKPPRGVEPEPEPVTIPVKVLIPTLVLAGGTALALTILEGIGLIALA